MTSRAGKNAETGGSRGVVRTLELLWDMGPRAVRGPRPGQTLDRIVETAVRIADAHGLDAVSMRRIAAELGIGTMSLYRYVAGKDELVDLMLDRCRWTGDCTDAPGADWRTVLECLAREGLARCRRHPWLLRADRSRPAPGPAGAGGREKVISRIRPMGLPDPELVSVVVMIDSYVTGAARIQDTAAPGRAPATAPPSGESRGPDVDHFEFGLKRILDGLEAFVERSAGATGGGARGA
ncbi:TetR/AcrR family transcriptional regulator [Streptomyces sp. NPDC094448]|uniref:TetR/AcrR family transcriptional regulator n=1 Tax=Streptomyces sp. NPDC094448 TaxID=3366063 RepID=UPI003802D81F